MEYKCWRCGKEIDKGGLIVQNELETSAICFSCLNNLANEIKEEEQEKDLADFMTEFERLHEENKDKYDYE